MPKPPPKFKQTKKQREIARITMLRLRREHPEKFTAEARRRKPKVLPTQALAQAPPPPAAAPPSPKPEPQPMNTQPDTELFGTELVPPPKQELPPPPPPGSPPGGQPGGTVPPPPETSQAPPGSPPPQTTVLPADTRKLALLVWGMMLNLLSVIFGPAMLPRKRGTGPGEIPYDENEMVVGAWMDYFASIGLKPFSPLTNLWLAILAYMIPRGEVIIVTVKGWFSTKPKAARSSAPPPTESGEESPRPATESADIATPPPPKPPGPPEQPPTASREEAAAAVELLE